MCADSIIRRKSCFIEKYKQMITIKARTIKSLSATTVTRISKG